VIIYWVGWVGRFSLDRGSKLIFCLVRGKRKLTEGIADFGRCGRCGITHEGSRAQEPGTGDVDGVVASGDGCGLKLSPSGCTGLTILPEVPSRSCFVSQQPARV